MRVSVAMCTFNGEKYLGEQLESIARQTKLPDELVICDDCSTDDTLTILHQFAGEAHMEVRVVVNEANLGSSANFDKAISLCTGDIIFLTDQDDVWFEQKVEQMLAEFTSPHVNLVFTDGAVIDKNGKSLGYTLWHAFGFSPKWQAKWVGGSAVDVLLRCNVVTGATMAFRSQLRHSILPLGSSWVHDAWIAIIAAAFFEPRFLAKPLIYYRQHGANQLGAGGLFARSRIAKASRGRIGKLQTERQGWVQMLLRMRELQMTQEIGVKVEAKMAHLGRRERLLTQKSSIRLVGVVRELMSGGYHRYGKGMVTAMLDLFARH